MPLFYFKLPITAPLLNSLVTHEYNSYQSVLDSPVDECAKFEHPTPLTYSSSCSVVGDDGDATCLPSSASMENAATFGVARGSNAVDECEAQTPETELRDCIYPLDKQQKYVFPVYKSD